MTQNVFDLRVGSDLPERLRGSLLCDKQDRFERQLFFRAVSGQSIAENWCRARESNPRPTVYKTAALPLS